MAFAGYVPDPHPPMGFAQRINDGTRLSRIARTPIADGPN